VYAWRYPVAMLLPHLHADDGQVPVAAGLYACSPKAAGYVAEFAFLRLSPV
jgi:uncharacterized protein